MAEELLFIEPVFKEKVWGGHKLRELFSYEIPSEQTGECWGISAHKEGSGKVINGIHQGMSLRTLWQDHQELFLNQEDPGEFPLLVKIIDATDDLSVQVHPDDEQALQREGYPYGKTECWYIIDAEPGSELVYGHHAKSEQDMRSLIKAGEWTSLFQRIPVKRGDFVHVPSGTVHAIGAGITLLETQQSSDITYRFYDYDRPGTDGELRPLHVEASIACSVIPDEKGIESVIQTEQKTDPLLSLVHDTYFSVYRLKSQADGPVELANPSFLLCTVIRGQGHASIGNGASAIRAGDHFLVPASVAGIRIEGECELIVSHVPAG